MNKDINNFSDLIIKTFNQIETENLKKNNTLFNVWKKVVTSVKNVGQHLYEHSSIKDIKNEILLVEADHPGWIQLLQMNSNYILKGLNMYAKELKIKSIVFKLKGSNAMLHEFNYEQDLEKQQNKLNEKIKQEEETLNKFYKNKKEEHTNNELPQELLDKFESIRKSMLTND